MREFLLLPCVFSLSADSVVEWRKHLEKEASRSFGLGRVEHNGNETELIECYFCNWISLENAATGEKLVYGEDCETTNERTETSFGETCGTIEIRRSIFDVPYSEVSYEGMKDNVHRWDVKMTIRVTSSFEVNNDFLVKSCSMDDSLCVFDCEEDLCNRSGYDGYPDDGKFAHSVKSPPRIVLQKISYELNKSIKNEYDGDTDASVRQKFETRKTQWCYACTATFSGDELIQNTDCMEISEQSLALPILDYNCATKMDRQRVLYRNNWYDVWSLERGRSSYFYSQEEIISRYSNYDLIATGETAFDRRQVPCADNYCNNISGWEIINAFPNTKLLAENFTSLEYDNKRSKSPPESCFVCQEVLVSDGNVLESLEGEENCVLLTQNSTVEPIITEHKECGVTESWGYARKLDGTVATLSSAERRIVSWGDPSPFNCLPGWSYCYAYCQEGDKCNGRFI